MELVAARRLRGGRRARRRRLDGHVRVQFRGADLGEHLLDLFLHRVLVAAAVRQRCSRRVTVVEIVTVVGQRPGPAAVCPARRRAVLVAGHGRGGLEHAVYALLGRYRTGVVVAQRRVRGRRKVAVMVVAAQPEAVVQFGFDALVEVVTAAPVPLRITVDVTAAAAATEICARTQHHGAGRCIYNGVRCGLRRTMSSTRGQSSAVSAGRLSGFAWNTNGFLVSRIVHTILCATCETFAVELKFVIIFFFF